MRPAPSKWYHLFHTLYVDIELANEFLAREYNTDEIWGLVVEMEAAGMLHHAASDSGWQLYTRRDPAVTWGELAEAGIVIAAQTREQHANRIKNGAPWRVKVSDP